MADERVEDGDDAGIPIGAGGGVPEGATPRPQGPATPTHVSIAGLALSPMRDHHRFVTNRRFNQTAYDADTPYWANEGVRRSMDVETALRREVDDLHERLHQALSTFAWLDAAAHGGHPPPGAKQSRHPCSVSRPRLPNKGCRRRKRSG